MKHWSSLEQAQTEIYNKKTKTAVTIGNFDGLHRGHQAIIQRTIELARKNNSLAMVFTFSNHTEELFEKQPPLINQPQIREQLFNNQGLHGLDAILEIEFNQVFASLTPEAFFQKWLLKGLNVSTIVVGHDFKFGRAGRGDFKFLQDYCKPLKITVEQIPEVYESNVVISSSKIRQLISQGKIHEANKMLGYPFTIAGKVVAGEERGRKLGFPTANIDLEPKFLFPAYGVYFVSFKVGSSIYPGIASVGVKPTFGVYAPMIEVHLFDVSLDLYHQEVQVNFLEFIRPEIHFPDGNALIHQIYQDIIEAKKLLNQTKVQTKALSI